MCRFFLQNDHVSVKRRIFFFFFFRGEVGESWVYGKHSPAGNNEDQKVHYQLIHTRLKFMKKVTADKTTEITCEE